MALPTAVIRFYIKDSDEDDKLARFMVGKANMEQLAAANRRSASHLAFIAAWMAFAASLIHYMDYWPNPQIGYLSWLRALPIVAATFLPLLFAADWTRLRAPDMQDIHSHYSKSPASGFWILEFGEKFVGLIALDASTSSRTATIRHFYVQEPYPASNIQNDLLSHALNHCFSSSKVQQITTIESPLVPYAREALRKAGFVLEKTTETVGVFGWKLVASSLQRAVWEKKRS
ncbi:hypothetical protein FB45DRAFT_917260 [Roridomyces roridus]|uniref:N-acetyltransferase domain-containing protein n=1 Tax=Roridomyces roridus TaxID=1738132 RepID=A0AAD7BUJ3_9AGAR|nr:hypothetical protein FB45DRAFT_917260 [Roridomyces roridus]